MTTTPLLRPFTFFISYRRQDTSPIALLLKSEIERRLQFVRVFVDVEIPVGDHFPDRIKQQISDSHALIVLIGKHWMPRRDEPSTVRADFDWIVDELEYCHRTPMQSRPGDTVSEREIIPIFVDCERTFQQFELPESIHFLKSRNGEHIDYNSWPRAIGPLLDGIARRVDVKLRPEKDEFPDPDPSKAKTQPVSEEALSIALGYNDYSGWGVDNFGIADATFLVKTFKFNDFNEAADFTKMVSDYCRILDHHPEWRNVAGHVTVSLSTWDAQRRVTIYDLGLALFMNKAAEAVRRRS